MKTPSSSAAACSYSPSSCSRCSRWCDRLAACLLCSAVAAAFIFWLINANPATIAVLIVGSYIAAMIYGWRISSRETGDNPYMWNRSMLLGSPAGQSQKWYKSIWFWWLVNLAVFTAIYVRSGDSLAERCKDLRELGHLS